MKRPCGPTRQRDRVVTVRIGGQTWSAFYRPKRGVSPMFPACVCDAEGCIACSTREESRELMKRPTVKLPVPGQELVRLEVPKLLAKLPNVAELIVQPGWEEGSGKGERALFCFVSATLVKLLVKVEVPPLKLMVSGRSWDEAWAALEAVLRSEDVPWEQDSGPADKAAKKKR